MNGVAAEIAQKIGMLFEDANIHAHAGEQKAEHHAGGATSGNATAG